MIKNILIQYNMLEKTIEIKENDFSTFEALGVLEATKQMISNDWLVNE